ncbi:hypothetical protein [Sinorhizobium sp. P24N7]|uniref:hypothetical protein n=1 Tax=unclassified Sinorhizobium TaxID=2613772 RepID=UPI0035F352E6
MIAPETKRYCFSWQEIAALVDDIMRPGQPVASVVIPGYQDTLADRTRNPGIAALENGRAAGPSSGAYTQRRSANTEAVERANIQTPETLQTRTYEWMRGQVSGTYLATAIAAVVARAKNWGMAKPSFRRGCARSGATSTFP